MAMGGMALQSAAAIEGQLPLAEAGLIAECRRGDQQAFARLVAMHQGMVFNLSARLLGDGEEARDLAQEVFLQVYRTLGTFRGQSSLKTWIYRIVVNQAHNRRRWWHRRRREKAVALELLGPADQAQLVVTGPGGSPYDQVRRQERQARVQAALLRIGFEHRTVLLLKEVEELSCEEIAATLGVACGTVKSRLARGREALRRALATDGGETK